MPLSKSALWRKEIKNVFKEGGYTLGEAAKQAASRRRADPQQAQEVQEPEQVSRPQTVSRPQPISPPVRSPQPVSRPQPVSQQPIIPQVKEKQVKPSQPKQKQKQDKPQPTIQEARVAFDKYYTAENRTRPSKQNVNGHLRFNNVERSKAYDTNYTSPHVISDDRYLKNPYKYDFLGVDTGPKIRKNRKVKV